MATPVGKTVRNKRFLLDRLKVMYGDDFHPIMKMAENAVSLQKLAESEPDANTLKSAVDAWDKVAAYTEPKLKAVEISTDDDGIKVVTKVVREFVSPAKD